MIIKLVIPNVQNVCMIQNLVRMVFMKKNICFVLLLMVTFSFGIMHVNALERSSVFDVQYRFDGESAGTSYCSDANFKKPIRFIGRIFSILKILIPIIIIIFGVIDVSKAVIGSKDEEIKKSIKSLTMRVISGVVIFFIPTLINLLFTLVDDWNKYSTDYSNCSKCLTDPNHC